tara:strand:- start:3290 stop:3883 length:594 start_codon:yes stop_codon:yes gene_type:complete
MEKEMTKAFVAPMAPAFSVDELLDELKAEEDVMLEPYKDTKGLWTVGIGHKIGDGSTRDYEKSPFFNKKITESQAMDLAKKDVGDKLASVRRVFGRQFFSFDPELQLQVVSSFYRGGLSGSPKTIQHIKDEEFGKAAAEFLDNDEYRDAVKAKTGVAPRMRKLSAALKKQESIQANIQGPPKAAKTFQEAVERRLAK